jgi:hypothetical protein
MALTLECGTLMAERRNAQAIADAAAMAAACDLTYNFGFNSGLDSQGSAVASALATAAASGYTNDGTTSTVTVNIPPLSGDYVGQSGYAEVIVLHSQPRAFSAIFGSTALPVTARSVARGSWQPFPIAFLALELALLNGPINAPINTGVTPTPDPLSYLSPPNPNTLPVQRSSLLDLSLNQTVTLQPGIYYGGIRIAGTANVTMSPGIYYMAGGGFTVATLGTVTGTGVTIVNAPILPTDAISIAASGNFNITPPTTGLYAGISIMQPPELINLPLNLNPPLSIAANSLLSGKFSLGGTIYAPNSIMTLAANAQAQVGSQVICRMAVIAGNGNLQINWNNNTARQPLPVKLVE